MWCWRRMLRISWQEHKTNVFVRNLIGEDRPTLSSKINKNKLQYFGHISRREGDNLEKIFMQGCVAGSRRRGRQKLRWTDGIKELTGLSINVAYRSALDRQKWNYIINRVTKGQPWLIGRRRRMANSTETVIGYQRQNAPQVVYHKGKLTGDIFQVIWGLTKKSLLHPDLNQGPPV